jgi:hypothetical protein
VRLVRTEWLGLALCGTSCVTTLLLCVVLTVRRSRQRRWFWPYSVAKSHALVRVRRLSPHLVCMCVILVCVFVCRRLAEEALNAPPPEGWREGFDEKTGAPYYCNLVTVRVPVQVDGM